MAKESHKIAVPVRRAKGTLIIIGGHEDRTEKRTILREVAKQVKAGRLVIATVAAKQADEYWNEYRKTFKALGANRLDHLRIESREDAMNEDLAKIVERAHGIFFT